MMKNTVFILSMLFIAIFLTACKEDKPDEEELKEDMIRVNIHPLYDGEPLDFNTIYLTQEGYRIRFTKLNFIATEFKNETNTSLFKSAVYRFEENGPLLHEGIGDYTTFDALTGFVGVIETENHEDPSARPIDDPLNIMNTSDMHWGWDPGYIFAMIEGKIDTTGTPDAELNASFLYHPGRDQLLQGITLSDLTWTKVADQLHATDWYLDVEKIFNGTYTVDIKDERTSHTGPGQEELSEKIIVNLKDAIRTQ